MDEDLSVLLEVEDGSGSGLFFLDSSVLAVTALLATEDLDVDAGAAMMWLF